MAGGEFEEDLRGDAVGQVADYAEPFAGCRGCGCEVEVEHVLRQDGDSVGWELGAEMGGEVVVKLNGQDMSGAGGKGSGDGPGAGADFNDSSAVEIAQ